jgi:Calx-beta domain
MFSINHLPHRARRAAFSTLLASCTAVSLLSGMVPSASAQSANLSVSIDDVAVTEGTDTAAVFTVTVSGRHSTGISVDWKTLDGIGTSPAVAGLDYVAMSDTLNIPASDANDDHLTGTISVPLIDDATHEPIETFRVKLLSSSVSIATNGGGTGTATITSNEKEPQIRIRDAQASEDAGSMIFNVDLDLASNVDVTVDYDTCDTLCGATATYSEDYKPTRGTLTFPANTNPTKHIEVPLIDDNVYEGNEQIVVQLSRRWFC